MKTYEQGFNDALIESARILFRYLPDDQVKANDIAHAIGQLKKVPDESLDDFTPHGI